MCGRFVLEADAKQLKDQFGIVSIESLPQGYNIAPTEQVLCLKPTEEGLTAVSMKWGITPWYQAKKNTLLFNARQESVADKPAFRKSFKYRRCLMVMSGFFEWQHKTHEQGVQKQPFYITQDDHKLLAVAAIWEPDRTLATPSCCLLTTDANESLKNLHNRMPWILNEEQQEQWLQLEPFDLAHLELVKQLGHPIELTYFPVSTAVNNARYKAKNTTQPL